MGKLGFGVKRRDGPDDEITAASCRYHLAPDRTQSAAQRTIARSVSVTTIVTAGLHIRSFPSLIALFISCFACLFLFYFVLFGLVLGLDCEF